MSGYIVQDRYESSQFDRIMIGNSYMVRAIFLGANAYVTSALTRDLVAENPESLDKSGARNITR